MSLFEIIISEGYSVLTKSPSPTASFLPDVEWLKVIGKPHVLHYKAQIFHESSRETIFK